MYDREYEYVSAIAKAGTLSGAALELGVSQPALTHFLKREEGELGTAIFQRISNRMVLTYAGECYMESIQQILNIQSRMRTTIQDIARLNQGRLRVGIPSIRRPFTIFSVVPSFKKKYPAIDFTLVEQSSDVLEKMLEELELDCIAVNTLRRKDRFVYVPVAKEHYILAVHKDSPLLEQAAEHPDFPYPVLQPQQLAGQTFVMLDRNHRIRQYADSILDLYHVDYVTGMHSRSLDGALEAVANNLGCTFTPDVMLGFIRGGENVRRLCVENSKSEYEFNLVYRRGAYLPPSTKDFLTLFQTAYHKQKEQEK